MGRECFLQGITTLFYSRPSWYFACVILVFTSMNANAIGLGNIKVNSALNEPLSAQIPILRKDNETTLSASNITVGLASAAAHQSAGIVYSGLVQNLRFSIVENTTGQIILRVHSQIAVYEPLLSFMVRISSSAGNLIKEYSVILDPASYQRPAQISEKPSRRPATSSRESYRSTKKPNRIIIHGNSYTVKRGDSLSKIAIVASRNSGLGTKEYMQAIFAGNPDAFQGSMDILLADARLMIPTAAEIIKQNNSTPQHKSQATSENTPKTQIKKSEPRLQLVPPDPEKNNTDIKTTKNANEEANKQPVAATSKATSEAGLKAINKLKEQLALMQGKNQELENSLGIANNNLAQLRIEVQNLATLQQGSRSEVTDTGVILDWKKWLPLLMAFLAGLLILFLLLKKKTTANKKRYNSLTRQIASMDEDTPTSTNYIPETIDVPTFTEVDGTMFDNIGNVPDIKDDLIASQEISQPTIQTSDTAAQAFIGSNDPYVESSQNLNAAQEAEIYLAYQQFKLAKKTIDKLLDDEPGNYKYKILRLQLLAKTAKLDELQELSVDLFKQFPDRKDEVHQRIQEICDMAFTANQQNIKTVDDQYQAADDLTGEINLDDDTVEMLDQTLPDQKLDDTILLNDDITEFLSEDLTLNPTDPTLETPNDPPLTESDLPLNHTEQLEPEDNPLADSSAFAIDDEYDEISNEVTELLDDITESELEIPFDLEDELGKEEAKTSKQKNKSDNS